MICLLVMRKSHLYSTGLEVKTFSEKVIAIGEEVQ